MNKAAAMLLTILIFPDGSVEICNTNSFVIDFTTISISVQDCNPDKIFQNGFEPAHNRLEGSQ